MATVYKLLQPYEGYLTEFQNRTWNAERVFYKRVKAAFVIQRYTRGFLIREHIRRLHDAATVIQKYWRRRKAWLVYLQTLRNAVLAMAQRHYARKVIMIQALWRGYSCRKNIFSFYGYKRWLVRVVEKGEERIAAAQEFYAQTKAEELENMEKEAERWLGIVVFKIHHLLRTISKAGIYSDPATTELTDLEKLLAAVKFTDYMKRLRRKYTSYVKGARSKFNNKRLFPIIGEGTDYWYLSLAEMYDLTRPKDPPFEDVSHRVVHPKPFLWRHLGAPPRTSNCLGPYTSTSTLNDLSRKPKKETTKKRSTKEVKDEDRIRAASISKVSRDKRFHLYVQHYKPDPQLFDYVDYNVNLLLKHRCSIEGIELK